MCSNCSIHIKGLNWSGITLCIKRPWIMKHETEPLSSGIGIKFWSWPCNQGMIMKKTLGTAGGGGAGGVGGGGTYIGRGFSRETSLHYHLTTPLRFAATGRRRNRQMLWAECDIFAACICKSMRAYSIQNSPLHPKHTRVHTYVHAWTKDIGLWLTAWLDSECMDRMMLRLEQSGLRGDLWMWWWRV